jgi:hypothetical protein
MATYYIRQYDANAQPNWKGDFTGTDKITFYGIDLHTNEKYWHLIPDPDYPEVWFNGSGEAEIQEFGGSSTAIIADFLDSSWTTGGFTPNTASTFKTEVVNAIEALRVSDFPRWNKINVLIFMNEILSFGAQQGNIVLFYEGNDPNAHDTITP